MGYLRPAPLIMSVNAINVVVKLCTAMGACVGQMFLLPPLPSSFRWIIGVGEADFLRHLMKKKVLCPTVLETGLTGRALVVFYTGYAVFTNTVVAFC